MKIHVWGINYSPELTGIGPYNAALCESLATRGHSVRMVTTFCYYPAWQKLPSERRALFRTSQMDGVTIHRCWHYVPKSATAGRRIIHELSFVVSSFLRQLFLPRPDVLLVISPPLLLGAAAWLISKLKRARCILHVQDLQPDAAAGLGMLREGSLFFRALQRLERFVYARCERISAITPGMLRKIGDRGVPAEKLIYFPNGVELPEFWRLPEKGRFRSAHGFSKDHFLVVYSGNLGRKQGLDQLLESAALIRNPRMQFVICGGGAERANLAERAARLRLTNIHFISLLPESNYRELLVDADICVIPQQSGSGASFFPSKLLKTLAFSSPVLAITEPGSELDLAVHTGGFGCTVPPGAPAQIAAVLERLIDHPGQLNEWGRRGFKFVKRFEQTSVLNEFMQALEKKAAGEATSRSGTGGTEPQCLLAI